MEWTDEAVDLMEWAWHRADAGYTARKLGVERAIRLAKSHGRDLVTDRDVAHACNVTLGLAWW